MPRRTTVTLEDDVAARLTQEMRRTGRPFKEVLNEALRRGLSRRRVTPADRFVVEAHPLGLKPGLSYDDVEELLEFGEGPLHP